MGEQENQISFLLILHAGNAKSCAMEAIQAAKTRDFLLARNKLEEAQRELVQAHEIQTKLLVEEMNGNKQEVSILTVHAQDHLNGALITIDLATEIVNLYEIIVEEKNESTTCM
ncbi:MAG: PTS lactose/cellobiose transporter subunit IIA [Traorella sp.]